VRHVEFGLGYVSEMTLVVLYKLLDDGIHVAGQPHTKSGLLKTLDDSTAVENAKFECVLLLRLIEKERNAECAERNEMRY
jgi:hypothetical protein